MTDSAFLADPEGLRLALELLLGPPGEAVDLPERLPDQGLGEAAALRALAPRLLARAADLGAKTAFAHMDPPTPWIAWAVAQWAAAKNQNLLHPDTAPEARDLERRVIDWLAPAFGMTGGHMTPGSTLANLTAIWAARQERGVRRVVASSAAHVSVRKAADLLALDHLAVETTADGRLRRDALPGDLGDACLVLTAGTTSGGAVDELGPVPGAAWVHVDAAWAGPLRLSERHRALLDGIEAADSVAVSAHKWLYQPKESALVLFRDVAAAHAAISYGGAYLAAPNVGLLGSHGAMAAPLLATLLAFGRDGLAARLDRAMADAAAFAEAVSAHPRLEIWAPPPTGVVLWRPKDPTAIEPLYAALPAGSTSRTAIAGEFWLRNVAANPKVEIAALIAAVEAAADLVG